MTLQQEDSCVKCGKDIIYKVLTLEGKKFHPDCFTCTECGSRLVEDGNARYLSDDNGDPYCTRDFHL